MLIVEAPSLVTPPISIIPVIAASATFKVVAAPAKFISVETVFNKFAVAADVIVPPETIKLPDIVKSAVVPWSVSVRRFCVPSYMLKVTPLFNVSVGVASLQIRSSAKTVDPAESNVRFPVVVVIEEACWNCKFPALVSVSLGVPEDDAEKISCDSF